MNDMSDRGDRSYKGDMSDRVDMGEKGEGGDMGDRGGIPSEKIGQNIHPLESRFFVINYQHWTSTSAFWPILAPLDHWGGLGGLGGDLGGLQTPKMTLLLGGHFRPWNALFWVITTCLTMFLRFWVKIGPSGPKKGRFWPK